MPERTPWTSRWLCSATCPNASVREDDCEHLGHGICGHERIPGRPRVFPHRRQGPGKHALLNSEHPFLVSVAVNDLSVMTPEDVDSRGTDGSPRATSPTQTEGPSSASQTLPLTAEPTSVSRLSPHDELTEGIRIRPEDRRRGTMVTSLVVDDPPSTRTSTTDAGVSRQALRSRPGRTLEHPRLTRGVAKALVIDSAAGWDFTGSSKRGYGQVPTRIEDVLQGKDNEIRFVLNGVSEGYENYTYNIPVPISKGGHPYIARATLCYYPTCDRRQGVDYTSTEMDLHFGRIGNKGAIVSIDNNRQGEDDAFIREGQARNLYRKWDNVKHIGEQLKSRGRPRKAYEMGL